VVLSIGLGFVNEYRSEVAVAALHANVRHETLVWRDAGQQRLDVRDLLTGESLAAAKIVGPATSDSAVDLPSCAFMGTVVHQGSGRPVVVATGMISTYLVLVELAKSRFYARQVHPRGPALTGEQRHQRHVARRTAPFVHHPPVRRPNRRAGSSQGPGQTSSPATRVRRTDRSSPRS
jgi:hypothetical protein